ncbi:unnamed protein product [Lymnaea stagnalis]|uniref:G-protein coupled receptors family 1 profile domain-containing protein n=1 Tax=Lymnaea stagnalis TaxID=6523 RepID=A0AAV2IND4_LYMST
MLNMAVFWNQGFRDRVNISLFGLAVSDLLSLAAFLLMSLWSSPFRVHTDMSRLSREFLYLSSGVPHIAFARVTGWLTAFVAFERCLCIALPLEVRLILTNRRVALFVICSFCLTMALFASLFYTNRFAWKFFPEFNQTLLGMVYSEDRYPLENIMFPIDNLIPAFFSFVVVLICTIILAAELSRKTILNNEETKGLKDSSIQRISRKKLKVTKMVSILSVVYVVTYTPSVAANILSLCEPEFSLVGRYKNMCSFFYSFAFILEAVNSSVTVCVYYRMSAKFRMTFLIMFCTEFKG